MNTTSSRFRAILAIAVLAILAVTISGVALAANGKSASATTLEFDVSEDMNLFVFDDEHVVDGMPTHGSAFVTQGYLYPVGTLDGTNGVLPDGSPEFPDKVLGLWACYGYFVGEGGNATTGAWVISTQVFDFGSTLGEQSIMTAGYEIADIDKDIMRAITGGTGDFRTASGEGSQRLLGFNATDGVVLRVKLNVEKR
jgi:hypothetical protein